MAGGLFLHYIHFILRPPEKDEGLAAGMLFMTAGSVQLAAILSAGVAFMLSRSHPWGFRTTLAALWINACAFLVWIVAFGIQRRALGIW